jgi:ketosteroid isomerase-like protein
MKSTKIYLMMAFAAALILSVPAKSQTESQNSISVKNPLSDSLFFNSLVSLYVRSINEADTTLASEVWSHTAEISFIGPTETEYGWNGVKKIYQRFRDNFSTRKLTFSNLKYFYSSDISWLTYYWMFDATSGTNTPIQSKGRETQIWRKINHEWRLVHVHYSGMPVSTN